MEEFLGVLFCGGKGRRIENLTNYISKSFLPVYDKPVFRFGLELLEESELISEIILLTNKENDAKLNQLGYRTIIQDDSKVTDMLSGWGYVKEITGTGKNGVLVPSDNICRMSIDKLIRKFNRKNSDFLFSLKRIKDRKKLSEMGSYKREDRKFRYKDPDPETEYGVVAPYIIKNDLNYKSVNNIFEIENACIADHRGPWFDLGDYDSIAEAGRWYRKNKQ